MNKNHTTDKTKYKKYGHVFAQEFVNEPHAILDSSMTKMMALYTWPQVHDMDKNDQMQFGILVKNSIDGTSHLSVEAFSFRHICTNVSWWSAISMAKHGLVTGFKMRHVKNMKMDFSRLKDIMSGVAERTLDMKNVYGRWMVEEIKPKTVAAIGKAVPKTYLPEYIDSSGKTAKIDGAKPTAWKVYNDLTQEMWHRPIEVARKDALFAGLHGAFFANQG